MPEGSILTKENLIKIGALIVVIVFIAGMFQYQSPFRRDESGLNDSDANQSTATPFFTELNATLLSYEAVITVAINSTDSLPAEVKERVSFSNRLSDGTYALILRSEDDVVPVAVSLFNANISSFSKAHFFVESPITFNDKLYTVRQSFDNKILSLTPSGENFTVEYSAMISDQGIEQWQIKLASTELKFKTSARILSFNNSYEAIKEISWEEREFNVSSLNQSISSIPGAQLTYLPFDIITFNSTSATFLNLSYVLGAEDGFLVVQSNFTDKLRAQAELEAAGFSGLGFPNSTIIVSLASLPAVLDGPLRDYNILRQATVQINRTFEFEGKDYYALRTNGTVFLPVLHNESLPIEIDASSQAYGRVLSSLEITGIAN